MRYPICTAVSAAFIIFMVVAAGCASQPAGDACGDQVEPWREVPVCPSEAPRMRTAAPKVQQPEDVCGSKLSLLKEEISKIIKQAEGDYGVYLELLDEYNGSVGIDHDRAFFAASCYKIPLVLLIYESALTDDIDLTQKLTYTEEHYAPGAGILKEEEPGSSYPVEELASLAIIDSDNIAARMLLELVGRDNLQQYQERLGAENVSVYDNVAAPRDLGAVLRRLTVLNRQHPEHYSVILDWMKEAYPRDRIPAGIPDDADAASKTGTWPGTETYNDAAIVYVEGEAAFLLVIMSEDVPSYVEGMTTLAEIAQVSYSRLHEILAD